MPLRLHDVQDASALCWRAVENARLELTWHEREDLHGYLLVACWELSLQYDPERRRVAFSTFATHRLRWAAVDWVRKTKGRTRWQFSNGRVHERRRPEFVPLDHPDLDRVGGVNGRGGLDDGASRLSVELRALDARSRRAGREDAWLGEFEA